MSYPYYVHTPRNMFGEDLTHFPICIKSMLPHNVPVPKEWRAEFHKLGTKRHLEVALVIPAGNREEDKRIAREEVRQMNAQFAMAPLCYQI